MDDKNIEKNKSRLKIYYSLLITVICIIGVSFAWFKLFLRQSEENSFASRTCFNTTLTEETSKIALTDEYPVIDEKGLKKTPFTFAVKNNCSDYVKMYITIESTYRTSTSSSYLSDNYIKVNISPKGTTDNKSVILGSQNLTDLDNNSKGYIIINTGLKANEEKSYDLRIWMDEAVTADQGLNKAWSGKIVVVTSAAEEPLTLANATLVKNKISIPVTTPGTENSTSDEAILASAEDDYGTSYYFRGTVKNNYVQFANKCWRIVRVAGDNTVKIILHNNNSSNSNNPCSSSNNSSNAAIIGESVYNGAYNDNSYVGFMYGQSGSNDYASTHANINKSTIMTYLENWYEDNLIDYDDKIADTNWCADKTNITDTSFDLWNDSPNGLGYAKNATYYGATKRLINSDGTTGGTGPSLKCNGGLSKIKSKIGLITADESAYAGLVYNKYTIYNRETYLYENSDSEFWTMTPYNFDGGTASLMTIYIGYISFEQCFTSNILVRPLISLVSSTKVTGDGTSENPYVVD